MSTRPAFRNTDPDQLDRMIRVASPLGWAVLGILLAILFGGLAWSFLSTAPVKVGGRGVLQPGGGLTSIEAPDAAPIAALPVRLGQRVVPGQLLVRLDQPALAARVDTLRRQLAMLSTQRARLAQALARDGSLRSQADIYRARGLSDRLTALRAREAALQESLRGQTTLRERGFVTRDRIMALQADLAQTQQEIAASQDASRSIGVDAEGRSVGTQRELVEADNRVITTRRDLAEAETDLAARSEVRAIAAGRVVELSATVGDRVAAGAPLMRVEHDAGDALTALVYVPTGDGKKILPGMAVQVVPSTARLERDGYIRGIVTRVSELPATREAVQRTLKNGALVDTLFANGPPFEVQVRLERDPGTISGFAWSSELGGTRTVSSGTLVDGFVVTERLRLIALAFPQIDALLHWLRLA